MVEFAVFLVALCIICFVCACIARGGIVQNFRNALRAFFILGIILALILIGVVVWSNWKAEKAQQAAQEAVWKEQWARVAAEQEAEKQRQDEKQAADAKAEQKRKDQEARQADIARRLAETRRQEEEAQKAQEAADAKEREARRWRVWTINGEEVEARFQKAANKIVYLLDRKGKERIVPAASLSSEDWKWIRSRPWK